MIKNKGILKQCKGTQIQMTNNHSENRISTFCSTKHIVMITVITATANILKSPGVKGILRTSWVLTNLTNLKSFCIPFATIISFLQIKKLR